MAHSDQPRRSYIRALIIRDALGCTKKKKKDNLRGLNQSMMSHNRRAC